MHKREDDKLNDKRNYALKVFRSIGCPIGKNDYNYLTIDLLEKAKWLVLNNFSEVELYLE